MFNGTSLINLLTLNFQGALIMQLTYRGNTYQASTPVQSSSDSKIEEPKFKLIYRGSTYNYNPPPARVPEAIQAEGSTVTLIYRGMTYQRKLAPYNPSQKPMATNWRYSCAA